MRGRPKGGPRARPDPVRKPAVAGIAVVRPRKAVRDVLPLPPYLIAAVRGGLAEPALGGVKAPEVGLPVMVR